MKDLINEKEKQLMLPFMYDEDYLRDFFEKATGKSVSLIITDNATSILSVKKQGDCISVRIQRIFLGASADVIVEMTDFIKNKKRAMPCFKKFVRENMHSLEKKKPGKITMKAIGKYHNLRYIYESLNDKYFEGRITCPITWGLKNSKRIIKTRTLGSYNSHTNVIRINPVLDRKKVPIYFIASIVYHEMLHVDLSMKDENVKRSLHSGEFRKREMLFEEYERAIAYEKKYFYDKESGG